MNVEGNARDLFKTYLSAFTGADVGESRKISLRIFGVPTENRTGHLPNTSQKHYRLSQLADLNCVIM
jgi:hypothetical protein